MWSAPDEPADRISAGRPAVRRRSRVRTAISPPTKPQPAQVLAVTSDIELCAVPILRAHASYRDRARDQRGGLRAVIRASDSSVRKRVEDAAVALALCWMPVMFASVFLPWKVWLALLALTVSLIVGGALGVLPGAARAMSQLAAAIAARPALERDEPSQTVIECSDGATLLVTRAGLRTVVPLRALARLCTTTRSKRSALVVVHEGRDVVLAEGLSQSDARLLSEALRALRTASD